MNNTQLKTYPYKREAIRATLMTLLSDDHIRTVSPTTRRLVERNLKAGWCQALAPPPSNDSEVVEQAQIAKEMSTLALKSPTSLVREDEMRPNSAHSTMSVNAVADADLPHLGRFRASNGSLKELSSGLRSPIIQECEAEHLPEGEFPTMQDHTSETDSQPPPNQHHRVRRISRGFGDSLASSVSGLSLINRKGKMPPPRPPKSRKSVKAAHGQLDNPEASAEEIIEASPLPSVKARFRRAPPPTPSQSKRAGKAEVEESSQ